MVSDGGIEKLGLGCQKLDEIDLSWCNKVTDEGTESRGDDCTTVIRVSSLP